MIELLLRSLIGLAIGATFVSTTIKVVGLINKSVLVEKIKEAFKKVKLFFIKVKKKDDDSVTVEVGHDKDDNFNDFLRNKAQNSKKAEDFFLTSCVKSEVVLKGDVAHDINVGDEILLTD